MRYLKKFENYKPKLNEMYDTKTPIVVTEENYKEAMSIRDKIKNMLNFRELGIGTFLTAIWLWRIVDEFEFNEIIRTKKIIGGKWAVKVEHDFGPSFTGSKEDAIQFGLRWKSAGRLKGKLYLIGINALK